MENETLNQEQSAAQNAEAETTEIEKVYPTTPDADGWYYEDEGSEALGIESKETDGDLFKRVKLSGNRIAIVRELLSPEVRKAKGLVGKNPDKLEIAFASLATEIDGKTIPMPEYDYFKARDFNKIIMASNQLNF